MEKNLPDDIIWKASNRSKRGRVQVESIADSATRFLQIRNLTLNLRQPMIQMVDGAVKAKDLVLRKLMIRAQRVTDVRGVIYLEEVFS
jgi:hypothetical protein